MTGTAAFVTLGFKKNESFALTDVLLALWLLQFIRIYIDVTESEHI